MFSLIAKIKKQKEAEEEKLRQNEETAKIYAQYVKSFDGKGVEEPLKFVKSDVLNPSTGTTDSTSPEVYTLGSKENVDPEVDSDQITSTYLSQINSEEPGLNKKPKTSKVREIDTFIEELKEKQRVINERKELQNKILTATTEYERYEINQKLSRIDNDPTINIPDYSSTNIYIGNLSPNITEEILMTYFSKYGQITGIRIMPVKTDSVFRSVTSAFLSYVTHAQAENAKISMDGAEILNIPCKIGWAKNILKPTVPVQYTPQEMPFVQPPQFNNVNTQLPKVDPNVQNLPVFQVFIPVPHHKRKIIDLMAKYVSEGGQQFEQMIKDKESPNGPFSFLFEKFTPESVYYRWRVYSLIQGDTLKEWNNNPFKITSFGKIYIPPLVSQDSQNNKETSSKFTNTAQSGYLPLTSDQQKQFENIIANTTTTRNDVCNAMLFFINNSESAYQLTDHLVDRLNDESLQVNQKISLLYVLSDVLFNSSSSRQFSWIYRTSIEKRLPEIFYNIKQFKAKSKSKIAGQQLTDVIMKLLKTWEDWTVYSSVFTKGLESTLLGDDVDSFKMQPEFDEYKTLLSESDGSNIDYFETLSMLPFKYRQDAYKYFLMGIKELKSLCYQRGLLLVPSDRRTLVVRLVLYDKYHVDKKVAEDKRLELLNAEEQMNQHSDEGSDMDESDMDQEPDDIGISVRTKIKEATVRLQKTLMERTKSPQPRVEVANEPEVPVQSQVVQEPEPPNKESPSNPPDDSQDDDIDDIFAS